MENGLQSQRKNKQHPCLGFLLISMSPSFSFSHLPWPCSFLQFPHIPRTPQTAALWPLIAPLHWNCSCQNEKDPLVDEPQEFLSLNFLDCSAKFVTNDLFEIPSFLVFQGTFLCLNLLVLFSPHCLSLFLPPSFPSFLLFSSVYCLSTNPLPCACQNSVQNSFLPNSLNFQA